MEKEHIIRVLEAVAAKNGVPIQEVVWQIDAAIAKAIQNAKEENNRETLNAWACMTNSGNTPSAIEAVDYLSSWLHGLKDAELL